MNHQHADILVKGISCQQYIKRLCMLAVTNMHVNSAGDRATDFAWFVSAVGGYNQLKQHNRSCSTFSVLHNHKTSRSNGINRFYYY